MRALFRADASVTLGSGHVMRCLTLANALIKTGFECDFVCRSRHGHLINVIRQQGFKVFELPAQLNSEQDDAQQTLVQLAQHYQLLVLDHYELGHAFCQTLRQRCYKVMVIDDLANRQHDCELLLDQNLLANASSRYTKLLPAYCKLLLGPTYALLRGEFYRSPLPKQPLHILVGFGGSDQQNLTALAIEAIKQLKLLHITADIVIGISNPWRAALEQQLLQHDNITLHVQCNNMATLMQRAQLMLGAGGSTHWERCISGLPGLIVTVAENQRATTAYLDKLGACVWLGDAADITVEYIAEQLRHYLLQPKLLDNISQVAAQIVPANAGTPLVVEQILTTVTRT